MFSAFLKLFVLFFVWLRACVKDFQSGCICISTLYLFSSKLGFVWFIHQKQFYGKYVLSSELQNTGVMIFIFCWFALKSFLHTILYLCNICLDVFVFPPSWICVIYSWKARPWQGSIYLLPNQEITTPDVSLKCLRQRDLLLFGDEYKRNKLTRPRDVGALWHVLYIIFVVVYICRAMQCSLFLAALAALYLPLMRLTDWLKGN